MPKTIVTLTVLPPDSPEYAHERLLQIDCDEPKIRLLAVFAFMDSAWGGWWKEPTVVEQLLKVSDPPSPIMWVRGGDVAVDGMVESTLKKLRKVPNVEVVVVRKDMPAAINQGE